ncbi:hypothetical protein L1987_64766 [Smallanthus sonchifolius]|uniref:Uncharacterized protein n=1 Tax=Smallanthus sonchifolius TaxID=185202 RepID=A0ACB9BSH4_9ASTR|nr:hypothetical protein L1987_64766 [Smallanthus sonchifolius]
MNRRSTTIGVADDHQEMSHQSRKLLTEDLKVFTYDELKCATLDIKHAWVNGLDFVLNNLSHPNLVKLIGYCIEGELLFLVDEFYYGNFEDCLRYASVSQNQSSHGLSVIIELLELPFMDLNAGFIYQNLQDFTPKLSDYNVSMFTPQLLGGLDCDISHPTHSKLLQSLIVLPYCRKVT